MVGRSRGSILLTSLLLAVLAGSLLGGSPEAGTWLEDRPALAVIRRKMNRDQVRRLIRVGCPRARLHRWEYQAPTCECWLLGNESQRLVLTLPEEGGETVVALDYVDLPKLGVYVGPRCIRAATKDDLTRAPERVLAPCMMRSGAEKQLRELGARFRLDPVALVSCTGAYGSRSGWLTGDPHMMVVLGGLEGEVRVGITPWCPPVVAFRDSLIELRWGPRGEFTYETVDDLLARAGSRFIALRE